MIDNFGLYEVAPVETPDDIIDVAWRRYDHFATRANVALRVYNGITLTESYFAVGRALEKYHHYKKLAKGATADINSLMGECECDELHTCSKCAAHARVRQWEREINNEMLSL